MLYYTRFYRRRARSGVPASGAGADDGVTSAGSSSPIFPADNRAYSITFASHLSLPRLKVLSHPRGVRDMVARLAGHRAVRRSRDCGSDARTRPRRLAMGGLENCLRRFVDRSRGAARGGRFSQSATRPITPIRSTGAVRARRSCTRGLLGEALDAAAGEPVAAARFLDQAAREEIEPFVRASVAADHVASRKVGAEPTRALRRVLRFVLRRRRDACDARRSGGVPGLRPHDEHDGDPRTGLLQAGGRDARSRRLGARRSASGGAPRRRCRTASARSPRSRQLLAAAFCEPAAFAASNSCGNDLGTSLRATRTESRKSGPSRTRRARCGASAALIPA